MNAILLRARDYLSPEAKKRSIAVASSSAKGKIGMEYEVDEELCQAIMLELQFNIEPAYRRFDESGVWVKPNFLFRILGLWLGMV